MATRTDKIARRVRLATKHARQRIGQVDQADHPVMFILGCQRSGTTMLSEAFERDPAVRVYGELGEMFSEEIANHRLRPTDDVRRRLDANHAGLSVLKPLVESQRTHELLDDFTGSRGVWLYRHFDDVASSNLRRFGVDNGQSNLDRLLSGQAGDWRADRVSDHVQDTAERLRAEIQDPHDPAAIFWWCRNALWFEQDLSAEPRVMLCRYETLVQDPLTTIHDIYDHAGMRFPGPSVIEAFHTRSVGRAGSLPLAPAIRAACDEMLARLEAAGAAAS